MRPATAWGRRPTSAAAGGTGGGGWRSESRACTRRWWPATPERRPRARGGPSRSPGAPRAVAGDAPAALRSGAPPIVKCLLAEIAYTVRRSDRARYARIVVDASGVEVVVPRRMALRHVEPFVQEKSRWIERTLRRFREAEEALPAPDLEHGSVPYLGEELLLWVSVERGRTRDHVARRGDVLHVK